MGAENQGSLRACAAGAAAGAVEIAVTYPLEYAKTHQQLNVGLPEHKKRPFPKFGTAWYAGCSTMVIGNAAKTAVRFLVFDSLLRAMKDENGNVSTTRKFAAGFGAGVLESLFAVTPFENIKTTLVEDRKAGRNRLTGLASGAKVMIKERGPLSFFQGFTSGTLRQSVGSMVRLGSYSVMYEQIEKRFYAGDKKPGIMSNFVIGGAAGLVSVLVTQPLDTLKTRMQSPDAKKYYTSTAQCATVVFKREGLFKFWKGTVARSNRLILSGGIVFALYDQILKAFDIIGKKRMIALRGASRPAMQ